MKLKPKLKINRKLRKKLTRRNICLRIRKMMIKVRANLKKKSLISRKKGKKSSSRSKKS